MRKLFFVAMVAMAAMLFASCNKDNISKDKLIGVWKVVKHMQYYDGDWHEAKGGSGAEGAIIEITESAVNIGNSGFRPYKLNGKVIEFTDGGGMGEVTKLTINSLTDREMELQMDYLDGQVDKLTLQKQ